MVKRFSIVSLTLLLVLGGVGSSHLSLAQDNEPIKVAAIFDLTGPTSDVGQPYAEGMRGYVDWLNANGGINGHPIDLISDDYAYSVETAENLYVEYVNEGAVVFMGWGTGDTEAMRARIAEDEIPFMSASYSAALGNPEDAPYNFLVGTTYSDQLIIMLQFMMDQWVAEGNDVADMKVALFHHDSPFGTSPLDDGQAWAEEHGIATLRVAMLAGLRAMMPKLRPTSLTPGQLTSSYKMCPALSRCCSAI
jgi:branched-chain amino acid transport system substrate-binding protein